MLASFAGPDQSLARFASGLPISKMPLTSIHPLPASQSSAPPARRPLRRGPCVLATVASLTLLVAIPSHGDDVHLTNGAVFEGVSTEVTETHVVIEMPIGRLKLPSEQVARIVAGDSPIAEHRRRSTELLSDPASEAADFLELARWAVRQGLSTQARQSALIAARFSPDLDGLPELLAGLGYEHINGIGWLPYDEAQRSRGLVLFDGEWLTRREREQRIAQEQTADQLRSRDRGRRQTSESGDRELARESIELARRAVEVVDGASRRATEDDRRPAAPSGFPTHGPRFGARQNNVYGGVVLPVRGVDPEAAAAYQERLRRDLKSLATRAPGSLIPVQQHRPPN